MKTIQQLNQLEIRGLLELAQAEPDLAYMFRHALVHETTYSSLVRKDRKALHLEVGKALETLYPDQREELAAMLAWHFSEAGELRTALDYFTLAGDVAYRRFAHIEAAMQYSKAIEIIRSIQDMDQKEKRLLHLLIRLGQALEWRGDHEQALQVYTELEQYSLEFADPRMELASLVARAKIRSILSTTFDPIEGQALAGRALAIAEELGDVQARAKIFWILMLLNFFTNRLPEAAKYGELSLRLARKYNLREQLAYTLNDLGGFIHLANADYQVGVKALEEARAIFKETGNLPMLSDNLTELGYLSLMSGELNKAAEFAEEGYCLDQSIQNAWGLSYSQGVKAFINFEWGEAEEALRLVDSSIRLSDKGGFTGGGAIGHCLKSMLHTLMGDYQSAMEFALDAIQRTDKFMLFWKAEALSGLAFAQLARGEISEAETLIQQIEESSQKPYMYFFTTHVALVECEFWLKKQNVDRLTKVTGLFFHKQELGQYSLFIPYAYYYQGHTLLQMGNLDRAGEAFDLATRLARKANQRHVLWKALAMHSRLQLQAGNLNDARNEVGEAWSVIQYIADHAGSEDLRSSFLNLPEVKSVAGLVG